MAARKVSAIGLEGCRQVRHQGRVSAIHRKCLDGYATPLSAPGNGRERGLVSNGRTTSIVRGLVVEHLEFTRELLRGTLVTICIVRPRQGVLTCADSVCRVPRM